MVLCEIVYVIPLRLDLKHELVYEWYHLQRTLRRRGRDHSNVQLRLDPEKGKNNKTHKRRWFTQTNNKHESREKCNETVAIGSRENFTTYLKMLVNPANTNKQNKKEAQYIVNEEKTPVLRKVVIWWLRLSFIVR